jgi:hypothetical protein
MALSMTTSKEERCAVKVLSEEQKTFKGLLSPVFSGLSTS